MPTVSVILNTYNRAGLLPRAVDSVLGQTLNDWELFICDDASDDGTEAVARGYLKDRRVRYVRQPTRFGNVTRGRNDALELAAGRYVCFLDDDNAMAPEKLERMSTRLDARPDVGMSYCRSRRMHMDGSLHEVLPMNKPDRFELQQLREINYIDSNEVMIRRDTFDAAGYFDQRAMRFEDWEMWNRIAVVAKIECLDEALSWYCTHPGQRVLEPENDQDNLNTRNLLNWKLAHGFPRWRTLIVWPTLDITPSQRDCMSAIAADLEAQDWIEPRYTTATGRAVRSVVDDERPAVVVLWMLFRHRLETLAALRDCGAPVVAICVEDPYAIFETIARIPNVAAVFTNEAAAADLYRDLGQSAAAVMPTLSACRKWDLDETDETEATHDVAIIGYGYPERIIALRKLAMSMDETTFLAVGGGWEAAIFPRNVTTEPPVERAELIKTYRRGRAILVLNRVYGAPPRLQPRTPARGFVEALSDRPVVHDGRRADLPAYFVPDSEVLVGETTERLASQIRRALENPDFAAQMAARARTRAGRYTYGRRYHELINRVMAARVSDIP